jgi:predicted enzyme related to lactoylglutathione lyase
MLRSSWVEIPAINLERALAFYQAVFELPPTDILADEVRRIAILNGPSPNGPAGVSLNQTANFVPSDQGVLVYFFVEPNLSAYLERAVAAGGTIIEPKAARPAGGFFATIKDSEGNLLTLNSPS